ncbi:two-component system, NtrC family, nitrogen regulation sensor histidine kinase GlnL [Anaerolineales bacterium]|nr:two-component system, NtrC family, nitrogen regulation sensor histidine kinase GlnL [Anaerolineales bacterium]
MIIFCSFRVGRNLEVTSVNSELEQRLGDEAKRAIGEPYYYFIPKIYSGPRDAVQQVLDEGRTIVIRGFRILWICDEMTMDITISPLYDNDSTINGAEIAMVASQRCLPMRESDHFRSLIDIGKVSATLAHGVRNPLNAIKGAVVYLKHRYGSDETFVEFADIIDEEIAKLDAFITRFLSTSLLEMEKSRSDIHELLEKIMKITSLQAQERNIRFVCDYTDVPLLEIDTFHLESAILNIVNNAIEAMESGGTITFRTRMTTMSSKEHVTIDICDSGPGVPESAFRNLLCPPSGTARDKGRGFGLFISREIVQHHGGNLEILNAKGSGATVRLYLPVESPQGEKYAG